MEEEKRRKERRRKRRSMLTCYSCMLARHGSQHTTAIRLCIQHTGTFCHILYNITALEG
jgi:hypothetical protein